MTGLESFENPAELGPIYPFPGLEWLLVLIVVILWILWHVKQTLDENREYREALEHYERIGLDRAMHHGGGADIAHPEEVATARSQPPSPEASP